METKIRVFICDDEIQILSDFKKRIEELQNNVSITVFTDGECLLDALASEDCDVLLLDIDMPKTDGLSVAKSIAGLNKKPLLIFVTGHDELVYDSLQFHPFGFIRKSYFDREIGKMLDDCMQELALKERHFNIRVSGKDVRIMIADILYFEADGNYIKVCCREDKEYCFRSTITAVLNTLSGFGFIRIHKGFLVNQAAVKVLGAEEAELMDGTTIPIGKSYGKEARQQLMRYMRS